MDDYKKKKRKEYNDRFKAKHKDEKEECPICKKTYNVISKNQHLKTKFHKAVEEIISALNV